MTVAPGSSPQGEQLGSLVWLQDWYTAQCDGDWEHQNGISIDTLDNPGWSVRIDLARTGMHGIPFDRIEVHRGEHDWYVCWADDSTFESACGPTNLGEALHAFRTWCQRSKTATPGP
jgi:hypothetical protein